MTDLDDDQYLEQGPGQGVRLQYAVSECGPGVPMSLLQPRHQAPARGVQLVIQRGRQTGGEHHLG